MRFERSVGNLVLLAELVDPLEEARIWGNA